jgi:hypothetical protein
MANTRTRPTAADIVVLDTVREAAWAQAARDLRRGQMLLVTRVRAVGAMEERLVTELEARGLELGCEAYLALAPEGAGPQVVAGATPECAERAAALIEATGRDALVVASFEAAELSGLHRDLAGGLVLAEAASAVAQVEEALEELAVAREAASVLLVGSPGPLPPAVLAILDRRGIRTGFALPGEPLRAEGHDLVLSLEPAGCERA